MTHLFESESSEVKYEVKPVSAGLLKIEAYLRIKKLDKGFELTSVGTTGKTEEELLQCWKENNDSKYVRSY